MFMLSLAMAILMKQSSRVSNTTMMTTTTLASSPSPHKDPGASQGAFLHAVPWPMALIEPPWQATPAVVASLAKVIATALRTVQAMEPSSQNWHHATTITANAGVDGVLHDANVLRVIRRRGFPRLGNNSQVVAILHFLASQLIISPKLFLYELLKLYANKWKRTGMMDPANAAAIGWTARRTGLAHEVSTVHRHGLVEKLLTDRAI